jgi:hypothetical protein
MAVITTYVCDVSGKQGEQKDFVKVDIMAQKLVDGYHDKKAINKLVHIDVARKMNLIEPPKGVEAQPEPTLESKLLVLLKEYIQDIAYEAGGEAGSEAASNSNRGG